MLNKLISTINSLPDEPGVYFLKDDKKNIIYIGKARSIKKRVQSYLRLTTDPKVKNIVNETTDIDFTLTASEKEAAFLENNFIQQYQPKFNLKLKDDKSFPYVKITLQDRFPGIYLTRRVEYDGAKYFGPFSPAYQARNIIQIICKYFNLRTCKEKIPGNRKRSCLDYDLKLCSAPCINSISESDYRKNVKNSILLLEGKTEDLLKIIKQKMERASKNLEFEQAAFWRDFFNTIEHIKIKPVFISVEQENMDIIGFARENENIAFYVFIKRKGKVIRSQEQFFRQRESVQDETVIKNFLKKYYNKNKLPPPKILLSVMPESKDKLSRFLSSWRKNQTHIMIPKRGKNKKIIDLANANAHNLLKKNKERTPALEKLKSIVSLDKIPAHIEGLDISNTGGDESVGSIVVFKNGIPSKKDYRKFKIKNIKTPDDISCLKEVLTRRYSRILRENKELPDLILVDGGKGQLNASLNAMNKLGIHSVPVISLAKKEEVVYSPHHKNGLKLDKTSHVLKLLQNIRDESHRFALSFHRKRREKKSFS